MITNYFNALILLIHKCSQIKNTIDHKLFQCFNSIDPQMFTN